MTLTNSFGKKSQYFHKLLKEDKAKNLLERIEFLEEDSPNLFNRKLGFAPLVYENYWVVIPINGEGFAFSVGMDYEYEQPDVMIIAPELTNQEFQLLINEINCYVRDKEPIIVLGKDYTKEIIMKEEVNFKTVNNSKDEKILKSTKGKDFKLVDVNKPLVFRKYSEEDKEKFPCGYLENFNLFFADKEDVNLIVCDLR